MSKLRPQPMPRVSESVLPAIDKLREAHEHPSADQAPVTVLFLPSAGRSGSTLIDRLLGQFEGFAALGEMSWIWEVMSTPTYRCGCGQPYLECPFWNAVLDDVVGGVDNVDIEGMRHFWRVNHELLGPNRGMFATRAGRARLAEATDCTAILEALYLSVQRLTGCRVIVDTSKVLLAPLVLRSSPSIDARLVQLVRDPRAVAYSWATPKLDPTRGDGVMMDSHGVKASAAWWLATNLITEAFRRDERATSDLIRYEDFVADPQGGLRRLAAAAGEEIDPAPLFAPGAPDLVDTHSMWGNPIRFQGQLVVRSDDRWRTELSAVDQRIVTAMTLPLLRRYGYPVQVVAGGT